MARSRSVIVTGAAQGLGLAIARRFAAEGSRVLLVDRDPKVLSQLGQGDLAEDRCFGLVQDLSQPDAAQKVFDHTLQKLGNVDVLINNAAWSLSKPLQEMTLEEFDKLVGVNQRAPYFLAQHFYGNVSRRTSEIADPVIINIASVNALAGNANLVAYAGTKGALAAMTRAMAVEMAPLGIRVVAISPGAVDTPFTQKLLTEGKLVIHEQMGKFLIKRYTTCEEIADLAWFLSTPSCGCVTGSNWVIDGGYLAQ